MKRPRPKPDRQANPSPPIARAIELHRMGRFSEAESLYRSILATLKTHFDALRCLGYLQYQQGRLAEARQCIVAALEVRPSDVTALSNYGAVLEAQNHNEDALATYDRALALDPDFVDALNGRGNALIRLRRPAEALASYDAVLALSPGDLGALNNRGVALRELKRPAEALACHDSVLEGRPEDVLALNNRGAALRDLRRHAEALASYDRALAIRPDDAVALINRGVALRDLGLPQQALESYDRALALTPGDVPALNNRGAALRDLGRAAEALASFDAAIARSPGFAEAYDNKANLLTELGRTREAADAIEGLIRRAPRRIRSYYTLTQARRLPPGDPHLKAMEDLALDMGALSVDEQLHLQFALGKALAENGDHGRSFQFLRGGNALKRGQVVYDEAAALAGLERTRSAFTAERLRRDRGQGVASRLPVFIVGMPRSGTTLVEQILASHPQVFGAGEIGAFAQAAGAQAGPALAGGELRQLGARYVDRVRALEPTAERITNKTTDNFRFLGLISLAAPNARVVHVRRDPLDTCLSCFSKLFVGDQPFSYDLGELGRYHRAYEGLMSHWREVLPQGVMLEVDYEAIVGDLEGQARRMVAHCGLDWDPRCLDYHLTQRLVRTASATQVRQRIYADSVGRWRAYEAFLEPLIAEIGRPPESAFAQAAWPPPA